MFYVTARDAGRTAYLLGPFEAHAEAESWVDSARMLAPTLDSRAWFYTYGTASVSASTYPDGVLNTHMAQCSAGAGGDPANGCDEWARSLDLCKGHLAMLGRLA